MKLFARYISLVLAILSCGIFAGNAHSDAFSQVPTGSVLYTQLATLHNATWENDISGKAPRLSKSTELTRYEFAIEIAKSAIDFSAHRQAKPAWLATVPRSELRSLRALMLEFSVELAGFNVNTKDITDSIDGVLRSPESAPVPKQPVSLKMQTEADHSLLLGSFPLSSSLNLTNSQPDTLNVPLSKQFEFYAQLTTPPNAMLHVIPQSLPTETSSVESQANTTLNAGANMSINNWLSLRAGYAFNQNNQPQTLQQTLFASNNNSWFSTLGETDSIGGGLDVKVSPGLTLSGGISRLSMNAVRGQSDFSGTQLEGGVGVSGLDNRLLLSARLARLMPDDAASLASTAARLNLDFALSNSLSFNLLYQQMFSLSPQQDGKSTFAGGVNIHF
ncbi:MAG: hypothetical protein ABI210_08420 [Abditibacteriaceae bacterium]